MLFTIHSEDTEQIVLKCYPKETSREEPVDAFLRKLHQKIEDGKFILILFYYEGRVNTDKLKDWIDSLCEFQVIKNNHTITLKKNANILVFLNDEIWGDFQSVSDQNGVYTDVAVYTRV